jgi:hypothetical protein
VNDRNHHRFNFLIDSFPYANSIASVLEKFINNSNEKNLNILQINSYPGIFTKNILLAIADKKIDSQIRYCVHDNNSDALRELKSKNSFNSECDFMQCDEIESLKAFDPKVLILNNFLQSQNQQNLENLLNWLNLDNKVKMIIGCESKKENFKIKEDFTNYKIWEFGGPNLSHYILVKKDFKNFELSSIMDQEFKFKNDYEKYLDLIKVLNKISCPQGSDISKIVLNELLKLDGYSANSNLLISKFFKIIGNEDLASQHLNKARLLDTYNLLEIT